MFIFAPEFKNKTVMKKSWYKAVYKSIVDGKEHLHKPEYFTALSDDDAILIAKGRSISGIYDMNLGMDLKADIVSIDRVEPEFDWQVVYNVY
jgi:hypothetical protein